MLLSKKSYGITRTTKDTGETEMIKRFEVSNYRGFENKIVFDLSNVRDYHFHKEAVENGISKNSIIFGKNGSGKSNLGYALFDITRHLTGTFTDIEGTYKNLKKTTLSSVFKYVFQFGDDEVVYTYEKVNPFSLTWELLTVNGKVWLDYKYSINSHSNIISIPGAETVDLSQFKNDMSILMFIYSRRGFIENGVFHKLMDFVNRMLWFRSLNLNQFRGLKSNPQFLADMIIEHGKDQSLAKLNNFLKDNGIEYDLDIKLDPTQNHNEIYANYGKISVPLHTIWSTGTASLVLFFCWSLSFQDVSFLYVDEFDAFYHYELSELVFRLITTNTNFQSIVTTHNCALMSNALTRPDCCYIIFDNKVIKNLSECTDREIREAHNLENLYKNGAFQ